MAIMPNLKSFMISKLAQGSIVEGTHISIDYARSYKKWLSEKVFYHFKIFAPAGMELETLHTFISISRR